MSELSLGESRAAALRIPTVPCSTCGEPVDPLRAARVSFHRERFRYFCTGGCRELFDTSVTGTPLPFNAREQLTSDPPVSSIPPSRDMISSIPDSAEPESVPPSDFETISIVHGELPADLLALRVEPSVANTVSGVDELPREAEVPSSVPRDEAAPPIDVGTLLLTLAALGSVLSIALALAGDSALVQTARLVVVCVSCIALGAECVMGARVVTELHPVGLLAAPGAAMLAALVARITGTAHTGSALTLSATVVLGATVSLLLVRKARRPLDVERVELSHSLDGPCQRVVGDDVSAGHALDLRPGEEIVVDAGETVVADATITAGTATLLPWHGAKTTASRRETEPVVAGARVLEGRLRAVVGWAGVDRAWTRLTNDPRRRADLYAPLARAGRLTALRVAPFVAAFAALSAFASNQDGLEIALLAIAVLSAFAHPGVAEIPALQVARGVLDGLRRGIAFRSATAFDRAGRVSSAVFCARGTLLLGEPEVANIEGFNGLGPEQVLALVAGAEAGASNPVATSVLRAARARGVRPDGVRSPSAQAGLGVTAVASSGQPLVVGTRALMLRERISVAAAEARISDLETMGRSVLLVALGGRLVGVIGLQDGLRPGARASVQHLLDVNVEPVLLSGDARETCEAIGRALDIDHLRPEVAPFERGDEVKRLADGGAMVAVVGRSPTDDVALSASEISVALASAGSSSAEWSVQLASDDVRDAAYAIRLAHESRRESRLALVLTLGPAVAGTIIATLSLASPLVAPIAAALGTIAALSRLRAAS